MSNLIHLGKSCRLSDTSRRYGGLAVPLALDRIFGRKPDEVHGPEQLALSPEHVSGKSLLGVRACHTSSIRAALSSLSASSYNRGLVVLGGHMQSRCVLSRLPYCIIFWMRTVAYISTRIPQRRSSRKGYPLPRVVRFDPPASTTQRSSIDHP